MDIAKDKLTPKQFATLVGSIRSHYEKETPAPQEVIIAEDNIKVNDKTRTFYARVQLVTNWCSKKVHTVTIRFKANNFHILPKSIGYV